MANELIEAAIRRVKDGDTDAYDVVVGAYQSRLRPLIASFCPPWLDADEIAQRAFVEAFRKIDSYDGQRPGTSFFAWLSGIARVQLLLELRRVRVEARKHQGYVRQFVADAVEKEVEGGEELNEERVTLLKDCMASLPTAHRSVIEMRYANDASLATIAETVGKTVAAVKFQLFDIRRRLRDCVGRKLDLQRSAGGVA